MFISDHNISLYNSNSIPDGSSLTKLCSKYMSLFPIYSYFLTIFYISSSLLVVDSSFLIALHPYCIYIWSPWQFMRAFTIFSRSLISYLRYESPLIYSPHSLNSILRANGCSTWNCWSLFRVWAAIVDNSKRLDEEEGSKRFIWFSFRSISFKMSLKSLKWKGWFYFFWREAKVDLLREEEEVRWRRLGEGVWKLV